MAHFAHIDENNIVDNVIVADQEFIDTGLVGNPIEWIKTSYNTRGGIYYNPDSDISSDDQTNALRKNYAGIGFTYDRERDAFVMPKPFDSWVLNEFTCRWEAPVLMPDDGKNYFWNEEIVNWDEII